MWIAYLTGLAMIALAAVASGNFDEGPCNRAGSATRRHAEAFPLRGGSAPRRHSMAHLPRRLERMSRAGLHPSR